MTPDYKFDIEALPLNWYYYSQRLKESAELIIKYSTNEINRFPYLKSGKTLSEIFFLNYPGRVQDCFIFNHKQAAIRISPFFKFYYETILLFIDCNA